MGQVSSQLAGSGWNGRSSAGSLLIGYLICHTPGVPDEKSASVMTARRLRDPLDNRPDPALPVLGPAVPLRVRDQVPPNIRRDGFQPSFHVKDLRENGGLVRTR